MMFLTTAFALSLLGLFVNANPIGHHTASGITAIEDHFKRAGIVPDLLPSFNPSAVMTVSFPDVGHISPGQKLSLPHVATAPNVTITPANPSVPTTGNFTLMMVDARARGTNESNGQVLHWLANSATLQHISLHRPSLNVSTGGGLVVTDYSPPMPPVGTGVHRYVILLFPQPPTFSPPANETTPNVGKQLVFHTTDYIATSKLGYPIAGMFFEVQAPANGTVSVTSAVATSALTPSVSSSPTVSDSAS